VSSLKQIHGIKINPDVDYMTKPEIRLMKDMIKKKRLTIFRLKQCENAECKNLMIKSKKFCCIECKERNEDESR
jgi:hypothetical protein